MGRKDTITARNIQKMYEQLCLDQNDILHRTKLLLSVYRDVVWIHIQVLQRIKHIRSGRAHLLYGPFADG